MLEPTKQRAFAREIVEKLCAAGHETYWAGGCVRDQLLATVPKDYDVATDASPEAVRALFGRRRTIAVGAAFGVITVLGNRQSGPVEVATFRRDAEYSDGRHPDSVVFCSSEEDASRRDFTINGLFYDPVQDRVIDYVGGQDDLRSGIVRAIGDAAARIGEDKLRMLRAVRFAATLAFEIDPNTLAAVQNRAHEIKTVSAERIGTEIRRMLVDANRTRALGLLDKSALLRFVLPELHELAAATDSGTDDALLVAERSDTASAWDAILAVCGNLADPSLPLAFAAAIHRVPRDQIAETVGRRLRYSNKEIERASWLLSKLPVAARATKLPWPELQRLLIHQGIAELLSLREAIAGPDDPEVVCCREKLTLPPDLLNPPPLVTGDDLIGHGLTPGKDFAAILTQIRDAQLDGELSSREDAMRLVDRIVQEK